MDAPDLRDPVEFLDLRDYQLNVELSEALDCQDPQDQLGHKADLDPMVALDPMELTERGDPRDPADPKEQLDQGESPAAMDAMARMAQWALLDPLDLVEMLDLKDKTDHQDSLVYVEPQDPLEPRESAVSEARQEHRDPLERSESMDPLAQPDLLDPLAPVGRQDPLDHKATKEMAADPDSPACKDYRVRVDLKEKMEAMVYAVSMVCPETVARMARKDLVDPQDSVETMENVENVAPTDHMDPPDLQDPQDLLEPCPQAAMPTSHPHSSSLRDLLPTLITTAMRCPPQWKAWTSPSLRST